MVLILTGDAPNHNHYVGTLYNRYFRLPHILFHCLYRSVVSVMVRISLLVAVSLGWASMGDDFFRNTAYGDEPPRVESRQLRTGAPADVDVDAKRLADAVSIVRHAVEDGEIPGAVVLVARRGQVILHEALGHRDLERSQPMQPDSLFRMASNSKAVTAAAVMLLVDEGRIDLDAPVGAHLPAFDNAAWEPVTIRHLLTHTSGSRIKPLFLTPFLETDSEAEQVPDLVREVSRFAEIAPQAEPGTSYSYNNAGFNILAGVIEQLTGSYKEYLHSRLYEPLGMLDSCNHESDADHDRMSTVMKRQSDGSWKAGWTPGDAPDWPFPRGSGGMVSTAWDYALFCQMLLNQGIYNDKRILSRKSIDEMTNPQLDHIQAAKAYGLGWKVSEPGGTFSHTGSDGTYVWVDPTEEVVGMVLTQTNSTTRPRDAFRRLVQLACRESAAESPVESARSRPPDGYYKDIFMSGGKNLTSRKTLPAADSLGLMYEYYAGSDASWQNQLLIGNASDENGVLLYPDGQPRFRMLYVNGGAATLHGKSLTSEGRERLRQFYHAGGSYCGSCAGSFLSGRNVDSRADEREGYLHIFPFNTLNTGLKKVTVGHRIPHDSPLLRYRSFGGDYAVENIYHNNGNWLNIQDASGAWADIEVLAKYEHPGHEVNGGAAIWAYRPDPRAGRIVNIGCHPESSSEGEKLSLTEASFLYTLDGTGQPELKATLELDQPRTMDRYWHDQQPETTRIGDRQYHHFALDVPAETPNMTIELSSPEDVDLHLFISDNSLAFRDQATYFDIHPGATKTIRRAFTPGRWYISVYCATTVETVNDPESGFHRYAGDRSILNGAAYSITVSSSAK